MSRKMKMHSVELQADDANIAKFFLTDQLTDRDRTMIQIGMVCCCDLLGMPDSALVEFAAATTSAIGSMSLQGLQELITTVESNLQFFKNQINVEFENGDKRSESN